MSPVLAHTVLAALFAVDPAAPSPALKAAALGEGGTIALVAPASPVDEATIERATSNLAKRGYRVVVAGGSASRVGYLAGSDTLRARALNALFRDPTVDAIVCLRGGYGSPRILDALDYDALRAHPKIVVGYSDITALLNAIRQRTGLVVFHGPMGKEWGLGAGPSPFSEHHFFAALRGANDELAAWGATTLSGTPPPHAIRGGVAEGRLAGGNLSVICSLLGTPYAVETEGAILFLEDVGEKLYRIDRMLNQLRLAGRLREVRGVLLGRFEGCEREHEGVTLDEVLRDYLAPLAVPVLAEYPAGHVPDNVTLPIGARVRLDADAGRLSLLELPVVPAER